MIILLICALLFVLQIVMAIILIIRTPKKMETELKYRACWSCGVHTFSKEFSEFYKARLHIEKMAKYPYNTHVWLERIEVRKVYKSISYEDGKMVYKY